MDPLLAKKQGIVLIKSLSNKLVSMIIDDFFRSSKKVLEQLDEVVEPLEKKERRMKKLCHFNKTLGASKFVFKNSLKNPNT